MHLLCRERGMQAQGRGESFWCRRPQEEKETGLKVSAMRCSRKGVRGTRM